MNKILTQTLLATATIGLVATAQAETTMVIVSWGGAYTKSQQRAYHQPYMDANPGIIIVNDDSSSEGASKLRAQMEAGNVTWDLLDVEAPNAITLCDEGLVEEIDFDTELADAPDGTKASVDFGKAVISPCFIPQIAYSTTLGYRSDIYEVGPTKMADVFDLKKFPGKRALEKRPDPNLEWALIADGVQRQASREHSQSLTLSRTRLSGGPKAPSPCSYSLMEKLHLVPVTTAGCSRPSKSTSSRLKCSGMHKQFS